MSYGFGGICTKNKFITLIPLTIFWVAWEGRNSRAFDKCERELEKIRNK